MNRTGDSALGASPPTARIFTDQSVIHEDGWCTSPQGELLFWVPDAHRATIYRPSTALIIGKNPTRLNFEKFVHGTNWTACRST